MNRSLVGFNLVGILCLSYLCALQWKTNSQLGHQADSLEMIRVNQQAKLQDADRSIKQYTADLEDFHARLLLCESQLKSQASQLTELTAERDRQKAELARTTAAIAARDLALKQAGDQIQKLSDERNTVIAKMNEVIVKYNALVKSRG